MSARPSELLPVLIASSKQLYECLQSAGSGGRPDPGRPKHLDSSWKGTSLEDYTQHPCRNCPWNDTQVCARESCYTIVNLTLHRWLDETPVSRIIQRLTLDVDSVDNALPRWLDGLIAVSLLCIVDLISAVWFVKVRIPS